jgi:GTP cyclohydrolase IA
MKNNKASVKMMDTRRPGTSGDHDGEIAKLVHTMLTELGEDPSREGLVRTPVRAEKALKYLTSGYRMDLDKIVNDALFDVEYDEMVIVKDIEFFSMCEHHMLPFYGKAHVAYLPTEKVIGLSKIPRIVDQNVLKPAGVGVIIEARHFCMMMRGVEKQHSGTVTSAMLGAFRDRKETRHEFLSLCRENSSRL